MDYHNHNIRASPNAQMMPKVLLPSSTTFSRTTDANDQKYYYERPMMLNAWTQTIAEDFGYLNNCNTKRESQSQTEKDLLDKIRVLEENLRAHSEILSQIHVTSARKSGVQQKIQQQQNQQQQQKPPKQQHQQQLLQQQQQQPQHEPYTTQTTHRVPSPSSTTSVINQVPPNQVPPESVKYMIIAEGGNTHGEPIEIQLAEDDGALNLNSSADSGRLEICLADENADVKSEYIKPMVATPTTQPPAHTHPTPQQSEPSPPFVVKRRKVSVEQHIQPQNSNYYINEHGQVTTVSAYAHSTPIANPHKQSRTQSTVDSLLKEPKHGVVQMNAFNLLNEKIDMENVMVSIGPNNTRIPAKIYENITWNSPSMATRKLLMALFDRNTLATHSMTGKPSPAFKDHGKPLKEMLNPIITQDIIFAVTHKCHVSDKEVRNAITTKCADENKMMKLQMNKHRSLRDLNKENVA